MRNAGWLIGGFVLLTTGCGAAETSFEPDVFSEKDMCAVKVEDSKAQVCYGTSREEAEKIHLVSTKLDADEHAESILIMDRRWAVYMD